MNRSICETKTHSSLLLVPTPPEPTTTRRPTLKAQGAFVIRHYAGAVCYTPFPPSSSSSSSFLEKNRDAMPERLAAALAKGGSPLLASLFRPSEPKKEQTGLGRRGSGALVADTVASQFRKQLGDLMEAVGRTDVRYVRCLKPNASKSPHVFEQGLIADQLRCAGACARVFIYRMYACQNCMAHDSPVLHTHTHPPTAPQITYRPHTPPLFPQHTHTSTGVLEAIRISRAAWPTRLTHATFLRRFRPLLRRALGPSFSNTTTTIHNAAALLLPPAHTPNGANYVIGATKIYFRSGALEGLETQRTALVREAATAMQAQMRRFLAQGYVVYRRWGEKGLFGLGRRIRPFACTIRINTFRFSPVPIILKKVHTLSHADGTKPPAAPPSPSKPTTAPVAPAGPFSATAAPPPPSSNSGGGRWPGVRVDGKRKRRRQDASRARSGGIGPERPLRPSGRRRLGCRRPCGACAFWGMGGSRGVRPLSCGGWMHALTAHTRSRTPSYLRGYLGWKEGRALLAAAREERKLETQLERLKARLEEVSGLSQSNRPVCLSSLSLTAHVYIFHTTNQELTARRAAEARAEQLALSSSSAILEEDGRKRGVTVELEEQSLLTIRRLQVCFLIACVGCFVHCPL